MFKYKYYQLKAIVKSVSFRRIWNLILLVAFYIYSRITRRPHIGGTPYAISVEPSGFCNLHCPECPTGAAVLTRAGGMMDVELFKSVVDSLLPGLMHINLFFQGEPMLNRNIGEMIGYATSNGINTLMSTNGQIMSNKAIADLVSNGLTEIIFSVDGLTQQSYEKYRVGGQLDRLTANIKKVVAERKLRGSNYPIITLQFIAFSHNEGDIPHLKKYTIDTGADRYVIKNAQFNDFGDGSVAPPSNIKYRRYGNGGKKFSYTRYMHCWKQWSTCVVGWDGTIVPCCYDKNSDNTLGVISSENGADEVWNGDAANNFREKVLTDKYNIEICKNCPEGRSCW